MPKSKYWDEDGWKIAQVLPSCKEQHDRLFKFRGEVKRSKTPREVIFWSAHSPIEAARQEFEATYEPIFEVKADRQLGIPFAVLPNHHYFTIVRERWAGLNSFEKLPGGTIRALVINPPQDLGADTIVEDLGLSVAGLTALAALQGERL